MPGFKVFTLFIFNERIVDFKYDFREISGKPVEIDDRMLKGIGRIRQTAAQMWTLVTIVPFLVGDLVTNDDEHYRCFCILLKISNIATAQEIHVDTVDYLRILIEDHHIFFKRLYPEASILPKMHYMVHYPSQIYCFWPLVSTWTMRYETKLSVLESFKTPKL